MSDEVDELRRLLERYHWLRRANTDPTVDAVIGEMIAETEARLAALAGDQPAAEPPEESARSRVVPIRSRQDNGPAPS